MNEICFFIANQQNRKRGRKARITATRVQSRQRKSNSVASVRSDEQGSVLSESEVRGTCLHASIHTSLSVN